MKHMTGSRLTIIVAAFLTACAKGDNAAADSAATTSVGATAGAPAPGAQDGRPAARDAEHEFLRKMIDHHEGLVQMATAAMSNASKSSTQGDAHNLHTKQADQQKKMIADVQAQYGETVTPMVMPQHKSMADSLAAKTGADYDRTFYRLVVQHHQEGVQMVNEMAPRFTKPDVKSMAEKMRTEQQREITEFQRKAGS